jgi:tetratricopeptide (TPR) repeat protein
MDKIKSLAKRNGIRIYTIDAAGLQVVEAFGIETNPVVISTNPHLVSVFYDHATGWQSEKESSLFEFADGTGGRFIHGTNDLVDAAGSTVRSTGQLYYLGYLSKQPPDGRYHRIRVTVSLASVRLYARNGFFAGRQYDPHTLTAINPDGETWDTVLARANQAGLSGDWKQAAVSLEQLVTRFPNQAALWHNLGVAHLRLENPQRAVQTLQKAFALSPEDKEIGLLLARAFMVARYRETAAETLLLMMQKHPFDMDLLLQLGRVYEADSRPNEAFRAYRQALELTPGPPLELLILLIRTSAHLGRRVEAQLYIEEYLDRGGAEKNIEQWRSTLPP